MPSFRTVRLESLVMCLGLALAACDPSPAGTYSGTTDIKIFRSVSDEDPYEEMRDDTIVIDESDDGDLVIEWLGCRLLANDRGAEASDLLPSECEIELEDGRTALLTVGWPHAPSALGTTIATLYADPMVEIHIVARLLIDGDVYNPSYLIFTAR